ncbi:hypothetical protein CPR_2081 [Clostridium perfringens SM101]|uniref:Uncharacterized protein n=1 Tax=Clostridium perfringens (strain SM101 / Type A) TaxID=289380 RepID=Q0SR67_CLOPS|nr:hypothetical protein CPR_2081 [Clostridium perfringens SM101]
MVLSMNGLRGLLEAIKAVFPNVCIVHGTLTGIN